MVSNLLLSVYSAFTTLLKLKCTAISSTVGHKGRLDDLNADYQAREQDRLKKGRMPPPKVQRLGFSIDDIVGADEASCSRFKNDKFIEEKLVWPSSLQTKVKRFLTLSR